MPETTWESEEEISVGLHKSAEELIAREQEMSLEFTARFTIIGVILRYFADDQTIDFLVREDYESTLIELKDIRRVIILPTQRMTPAIAFEQMAQMELRIVKN